jgi:hypothetical protein
MQELHRSEISIKKGNRGKGNEIGKEQKNKN